MSRRGAGQQHHGKPDLGRDQSAAKTLLPAAAGHGAAAILQSINQIGARTLPRRIKAHHNSGQQARGRA